MNKKERKLREGFLEKIAFSVIDLRPNQKEVWKLNPEGFKLVKSVTRKAKKIHPECTFQLDENQSTFTILKNCEYFELKKV